MPQPISEIDVLWITAGLGCDGDSIAITAATMPSLEDLIDGTMPGVPRIRLHNPVLARENGADFLARFHAAARGELEPFILVVEGSIPDETNKAEGCWAGFGTDPETRQPIPTCDWVDRLAPHACRPRGTRARGIRSACPGRTRTPSRERRSSRKTDQTRSAAST